MPTKVVNLELDEVSFVLNGANPEAHIRLFKRDDTAPTGRPSERFVAKAIAAHPTLPVDQAIETFKRAHEAEYAHVQRQTANGTDEPFTAPTAASVLKRSDAERRVLKAADVLATAGVVPTVEQGTALALRLFGKGTPTADSLLRELAAYFAETRDRLRHVADERAAAAIAGQQRELVAALLNTFLAA
jgi:hypothetical protein